MTMATREKEKSTALEASLSDLDDLVAKAIEFAERWAEPYRSVVFEVALERLSNAKRSPVSGSTRSGLERQSLRERRGEQEGPLERLAGALGMDVDAVSRTVELSGDGQLRILGRLDGNSTRELQNSYSVVYCYIKEKALGEQQVAIDELRRLCAAHGCYDQANFTAYFRRDELVREVGTRGSRDKRYLASKRGLEVGERLLRQMIES
jgi:hypothetical protein